MVSPTRPRTASPGTSRWNRPCPRAATSFPTRSTSRSRRRVKAVARISKPAVWAKPGQVLGNQPAPPLGDRPLDLRAEAARCLHVWVPRMRKAIEPDGAVVGRHRFGGVAREGLQAWSRLWLPIEPIRFDPDDGVAC